MNIQVLDQTKLRLSRFDLEELNVSLENGTERYSAISMFVTSLARCTFAVLGHYAMRMKITTQNITMDLTWDFIKDPTRINQITMTIYWPELPEKRITSVERASHKCTISMTIRNSVDVNTTVFNTNNPTLQN